MLSFGKLILKRRKELGFSQKQLALLIEKEDGGHISPQYLNDIEQDRRNPSGDFLISQLARSLKLPEEALHYLADGIPSNIRKQTDDPERIVEAFTLFRQKLEGKGEVGQR